MMKMAIGQLMAIRFAACSIGSNPTSIFPKNHQKDTGREDFNLEWLDEQIADWRNDLEYDELEDTPENVQATLMKLTTRAIKKAIYRSDMDTGEV